MPSDLTPLDYAHFESDDLDDSDEECQKEYGAHLATQASEVFPETLVGGTLKRSITTATAITAPALASLARLIDLGLASHYRATNGPRWMEEKLLEMREAGLVYVSYTSKTEVACFVSFLITHEAATKVLYLYEIHVLKPFRGQKLGAVLLSLFHRLGVHLARCGGCLYNPTATALTVFSTNPRALAWYIQEGYTRLATSPQDKRLRSGKLRKPPHYIMIRQLDSDPSSGNESSRP